MFFFSYFPHPIHLPISFILQHFYAAWGNSLELLSYIRVQILGMYLYFLYSCCTQRRKLKKSKKENSVLFESEGWKIVFFSVKKAFKDQILPCSREQGFLSSSGNGNFTTSYDRASELYLVLETPKNY